MKELTAIVEGLSMANSNAVLATLVHVDGSSYRRPGARLLILEDGSAIGALSGGCLEHEIRENALKWTEQGPCVKSFDIRSQDETMLGWGSGCNGIISVLLERTGPKLEWLRLVHEKARRKQICAVATVFKTNGQFDSEFCSRMIVCNQESWGDIRDPLRGAIMEDSGEAIAQGQQRHVTYRSGDDKAQVFIELFHPQISLSVFGSGDDTVPVVQLAGQLGWQVSVISKSISDDDRLRFPSGTRLVEADPGMIPDGVIHEHSVAVVMTHNYLDDKEIVASLLQSPVRYVGLLGGRTRSGRLCEEVMRTTPAARLEKLYAPIGLDIGALDADEIAIAIISEILAVLRGRNGGILCEGSTAIHKDSESIVRSLADTEERLDSNQPSRGFAYAK